MHVFARGLLGQRHALVQWRNFVRHGAVKSAVWTAALAKLLSPAA
jgi:hypothetical protein